ncbi:hypothetical protein FNF29_05758 [Cafeteria roenbergensis]|uniref:F-box domain-containing protein n=1 Tax=Cafeteria roenbergensis TaxID=33653 RepID=A0A5A8CAQ3_CAFRO|nr:hypothetical protein FNF29_05758 [Cafeteria roenbergensis]|eukprot:KAA0149747.1 hypothetical protein FNF29_05758 [Cafeteria roenbergensis]
MAAAADDDAAAAGPRQQTRFIVVPLYGEGQESIYDVPVNASVTIGRNDAHALDNQHISRRHLCISVNYDLHGRALLLAHNTGKNTFRIVSFARRKHARVQQAKFCRLYSGDVVEMLYDTQARYAVQVLEVSVTGMPLLHHTPVVPSLYAFKTMTGSVPETSSQAAKQALELGMKHEEGAAAAEGEGADGSSAAGSPSPSPPTAAASAPLVTGRQFRLGLLAPSRSAAAAAAAGDTQLTQTSLSHVGSADGGPPRLIRVASDADAAGPRSATDDDGDATGQHGVEDAAFETGAHEDDRGTPSRAGTPALSREGSAQGADGRASSSSPFQRGAAASAANACAPAPRSLSALPTRVLRRALAFLSLPDLLSCACVSRSWESTVTTSGVLSTIRIGAFCPGVNEPPFRLLLNVATRSRWCLNHLSLARCRWATAGHLAMFLGLPIRLRPHAYSVATEDPSVRPADTHRVAFAPDGPASDPCALSPAQTALDTEEAGLGRQASAPGTATGGSAAGAAAASAGAAASAAALPASRRSHSLGPAASAGRAGALGKDAAMPFNLTTPENAVDFLADSGRGATSNPVPIEASTSQRWLFKTQPKPRRLLDAFLNLFVNRTLRAMSRAEALAIRDASAFAGTPAYGQLSSIRRDLSSLRGPVDDRLSVALTSRNVAVAYDSGQRELAESGREHARVAPRDPLTEDLPDGAVLRRGYSTKPGAGACIPGVGPVWVEQPMINKETFSARVTAAPSLRARAAIAAWAEIKLESLRPGFPSSDTKSPVALFKVAAATTRGIPVRRVRDIVALGQADDEASQNALDVANDNEDHDPALRAQEVPGRSGFFDMRLSRLPLGSVDVATEKLSALPSGAAARGESGADDATEPQSPTAASAPDTDSEVDSVRGAAVAGSIDGREAPATAAPRAGSAGHGADSEEEEDDSEEEEDLAKAAKLTTLRPATMSLGAAPGSAFAMLDSRGKAVDPYFLFTAVNMSLPAMQEHIASRSNWVSPWQAPLAAAEAAVAEEMARPTSASSASERAEEAASRAVRGHPATIATLQKALMDDISPADVVTWIPAPAFGATAQPRPLAITERHGPTVNGTATWLPPTPLQRMSDPVPASFASPVRSLDLHGCANINPMALIIILRYCPELTALRLGGMLQLALPNLMALPACVPNLRYIDLEGIHQMTDGAVHALAEHCPGLQRANFDGCHRLTDEAFVGTPSSLCTKCPDLRHLSLRGCESISGAGFAAIARACPKLVSLNLAGNQEVSIRNLARALVACPDLESLKVEIWHKQDKDHARFRILENVRRAARYCFKSLQPDDEDYQALAACERFAESLKAAEESRKSDDAADLDGSEAADDDN